MVDVAGDAIGGMGSITAPCDAVATNDVPGLGCSRGGEVSPRSRRRR